MNGVTTLIFGSGIFLFIEEKRDENGRVTEDPMEVSHYPIHVNCSQHYAKTDEFCGFSLMA